MKPLMLAFLVAFSSAAHAEPLHLLTEDYPPYNFKHGDTITGASTDQIRLIMAAIDQAYDVELLPWARAYTLTEKQPATCVYTTGHSAERQTKFKWVEPLLVDRMVMMRKAGSAANPATLEAAKRFTIGTQREDFSEDFLTRNSFPKIDLAPSLELTLKKLLSGRIDLMMTSEKTFESLKAEGEPVESALVLDGRNYGLACNLEVPDATIAKMQAALDRLISDGTQDRIFSQYGLRPNR